MSFSSVVSSSQDDEVGQTLGSLLENESKIKPISTGSTALDNELEGGIRSGCLYEISGLMNSGKLELVLEVVRRYLMKNDEVLWVDTNSKIPLNHLQKKIMMVADDEPHDNHDNHLEALSYVKVYSLAELLVLLQNLNAGIGGKNYSLIVINEFAELVHSSFLELDILLSEQKEKIDELKQKFEIERKQREAVGDKYIVNEKDLPSLGSNIVVRQNRTIQELMLLLSTYCTQFNSSALLLGSMNTLTRRLYIENEDVQATSFTTENSELSSSQMSTSNSNSNIKAILQAKLVPVLGIDNPWKSYLKNSIVLYKDWLQDISVFKLMGDKDEDKINSLQTVTCAILTSTSYIPVSNSDNKSSPHRKVLKNKKTVRFFVDEKGIRDLTIVTPRDFSFSQLQSEPIQKLQQLPSHHSQLIPNSKNSEITRNPPSQEQDVSNVPDVSLERIYSSSDTDS
ncbi:hypothetical protein PACTADRAFT_51940 [Pachysolen tannophilus NRRL Y-2460]|uniref:Rad51-like C-terminal domain-containing protein n=1 Tax=Pachysolen tannophilus NRRL Y-2460 TaxID=669874 RepID=A0A1E4TNN8_PACTA|nr:hypothetical protein PACTADRAFT_51940 [Pachysolen tannophilus NRRL Y-2460]